MFDVLTMAAVADELRESVLDGRIQKLGLVNLTTLAAEVYAHGKRRALVASADASNARIFLDESLPSTDPNLITPFGLQIRKYVRGGFIVGIEQPPMERIIRLTIVKRLHDEKAERRKDQDAVDAESEEDNEDVDIWDAGLNRVELIVEVMGRHSNLILVDAGGSVMESAKRVTSQMSRVRPVLPRRPYVLPPVPDKPDPRRLTSPGAEQILLAAKPGDKLADILVRGLLGVSPQMGREIAFRVLGKIDGLVRDVEPDQIQDLARHVRSLLEVMLTSSWAPRVYKTDDLVTGYSAVPMQHLAATSDEIEVPTISAAIVEEVHAVEPAGPQDHAQRRAQLIVAIRREEDKVRQRVHSLEEQYQRVGRIEDLKTWGEMIYAYLWQIQPGDKELIVDDMTIPLDPKLSAKDNAAAYFEDYRKSQKAGVSLPERIEDGQNEIDYLQQLATQAAQADGFAGIEVVRLEFEEHTGGRHPVGERGARPGKKPDAKRTVGLTEANGNLIYVGRSGKENEHVTFDLAGQDDTWLHARGVPGSHVIIRWLRPHEDEDDEAVATGAALAAWYSSSRTSGNVEVDVTRRKNVRKIKGAGPGMVTYRGERTVAVTPEDEEVLKQTGRLN